MLKCTVNYHVEQESSGAGRDRNPPTAGATRTRGIRSDTLSPRSHPTPRERSTMTTEQMVLKFVFDVILLLAGLGGAGLALWTWQKAYWEYQLRRQTEDWKSRQSYSRKDARRQAMEGLLTEL